MRALGEIEGPGAVFAHLRSAPTVGGSTGGIRGLGYRPLRVALFVAAADRGRARRVAAAVGGAAPALQLHVAIAPLVCPLQPLAVEELAGLWQLPTRGFVGPPAVGGRLAPASAPHAVWRPQRGGGLLRDGLGPLSIEPALRHQNLALPGAVGQGKSTALLASFAEDLARERCALLLIDPKGETADRALSLVPRERAVRLLDLAAPAYSFNPLAVEAAPETVADYVVEAIRNLFEEGEIRASSDRFLRSATIAVLAADPNPSLEGVSRLLGLDREAAGYRRLIARRLAAEGSRYRAVAAFFGEELPGQLALAPGQIAAKLDAPANKLARLLTSPAVARVLAADRPSLDLEAAIEREEVVIVKGGLGGLGAANTAVLLQLLMGMLDAILARRQEREGEPIACAVKIDEAPLAINRGFARTLALKRTAGLEVAAAWQADSQWEPGLRSQLDALFGHRIYFATPSVEEALRSAALLGYQGQPTHHPLADPQARLSLPPHWAIASLIGREGRLPPFLARTVQLQGDPELARHHRQLQPAGQVASGGRPGVRPRPSRQLRPARFATAAVRERTAPPELAELLLLRQATRFVALPAGRGPAPLGPPAGPELALLQTVARLGVVSTAQLHRHHGQGCSLSTTQRRVRRLAQAGLLERLRPHRRDGGSLPLLLLPTAEGLRIAGQGGAYRRPDLAGGALERAVEVSGWLLAAARLRPGAGILGAAAARQLAERWWDRGAAVEPDGALQVGSVLVLVERDDRLGRELRAKLRRYLAVGRREERDRNLSLFCLLIARSRSRAAALAEAAARTVGGGEAAAGVRFLFAAQADLFHNEPLAYALPQAGGGVAVVRLPGF